MSKLSTVSNLLLGLSSFLSTVSLAESNDKSAYTLFNPTPANQMRELTTDRPDATEGAVTVDAGHVQVELDIYNVARDRDKASDIKTTSTAIGAVNFRIGLTNCSELDLIVDPHVEVKTEGGGTEPKTVSGMGDSMLRYKINFIGNDGGPIAIGLIPFVKIPTAENDLGNDEYEGGIILPIGLDLGRDWSLGYMIQYDYILNARDKGYHTGIVNSMTLSHPLSEDLGGYFELLSESENEEGAEWIATVNVGLTLAVGADIQFDLGANLGATEAADDINPFVGFTARM